MKPVKKVFLLIFSLFSCSSFSQDSENSLLWSISGNGLEETSYLFGTMHLLCESDFVLKKKVKKAFNKSSQLYLELDMDDADEMKSMNKEQIGDKKLSEILSPEKYTRLDNMLKLKYGFELAMVDQYKLLTLSSLVTMKSLKCDAIKSFELEFMNMAKEKKNDLKGLETVEFQVECLENAMTFDELYESLFDTTAGAYLDTLSTAYLKEDMEGLARVFSGTEYMSESMIDGVLKKRNKNWIKIMPDIMIEKSTFFAVGAGHLLNEYGVIALLRAEGYVVEPIMD